MLTPYEIFVLILPFQRAHHLSRGCDDRGHGGPTTSHPPSWGLSRADSSEPRSGYSTTNSCPCAGSSSRRLALA